jgi:hypothetical protein
MGSSVLLLSPERWGKSLLPAVLVFAAQWDWDTVRAADKPVFSATK